MAELKVADTKLGKLHLESPNKLKVEDALGLDGLTITKTIRAGNEGDAIAKFEKRWKIAPGVHISARLRKDEGRGGEGYFTVTAKYNKGGAIKKYAKGGGIRKVRHD